MSLGGDSEGPKAPRNVLAGRRIALGVSGSIAAFKAVGLASSFTQQGALVDVIMTPEATRLIQPLSFQAITHRPVSVDMFTLQADAEISHVTIGHAADAFVVAPATAHSIAKLALGLADDGLTTTALATRAPCIIAPAMETNMWQHPATRQHVETLRERGWRVVEPGSGHLASGAAGEGRLADVETIVDVVRHVLSANGDMTGLRVAVTAGGTREAIDPVRYVSNRSSGKMGYALAQAARDRGARVTLISTTSLGELAGVERISVESAAEMHGAVMSCLGSVDALVMAAAVADYTPARQSAQKMKKSGSGLTLELRPTIDIIAEAVRSRAAAVPLIVGFAAETEDLEENAQAKLSRKGMDIIVANDVSSQNDVFGGDYNEVTIIRRGGLQLALPRLTKVEVAHSLWDVVLEIHADLS